MATTTTTTSLTTSSAPANTTATDTMDNNTSHRIGAAYAAVPTSSGITRNNVDEETVTVTNMTTVTTTMGSGLMTPLTT